jgi:hypothetical protein
VGPAALVVFAFSAGATLSGWFGFERLRLQRPPLGVLNLGDVAVMLAMAVLLPLLYLTVPVAVVASVFLVAAASALDLLLSALLRSRWATWSITGALLSADVAGVLVLGGGHSAFLAINNTVLMLSIAGVSVLWAQSGLRARDAALLGGALGIYDFIATLLLPLSNRLVAELAMMPLTPVVAWATGDVRGGLAIGVGDLLLATVFPLVQRKAYGQLAGRVALCVSIGTIAALLVLCVLGLLRGTFPVMIVLGPLLLVQHAVWSRMRGPERTAAQFARSLPVTDVMEVV